MKKILLFILSFFLFTFSIPVLAETSLSTADKDQIVNKLDQMVAAINAGNTAIIPVLVSSNNASLMVSIADSMRGGVVFKFDYTPFDKNIEIIGQDQVKVKGRFTASGAGWSISGVSTYFMFTKQDNQWWITDTDFYKKIGANYVEDMIWKIFAVVGIVLLIFLAFWIWMLVDCIKGNPKDKPLWLVLIIFLNIFGALIYFFKVKIKKNQSTGPTTTQTVEVKDGPNS